MSFGDSKQDGSSRLILSLSDKPGLTVSINKLLDPELCTVEYAQAKQVVETVMALGKNARLWANDLKEGYDYVCV